MKEDIRKRIDDLNDELKVRQESIDLLKGKLKNQITSFKETIAKVLDKDTSLAEKIRTLFRDRPSKFPTIAVKFPHLCLLSRITHEVTSSPIFQT